VGLVSYLSSRQRAGDLRADIAPELLAEAFFALTSSLVMGRSLMGTAVVVDADLDVMVEQLMSLYWSGASSSAARGEQDRSAAAGSEHTSH
jgi:hypothetical protein